MNRYVCFLGIALFAMAQAAFAQDNPKPEENSKPPPWGEGSTEAADDLNPKAVVKTHSA